MMSLEQDQDWLCSTARRFSSGVQFAYKSGWIDTLQGDVGIVQMPRGGGGVAVLLYAPAPLENTAAELFRTLAKQIYAAYR